jgi:hypothetical protein
MGASKDGQGARNRAQERVGDASVFSDAVIGGTFVKTESHMEVCGLFGGDEKGRVFQEATGGIKVEEILTNES